MCPIVFRMATRMPPPLTLGAERRARWTETRLVSGSSGRWSEHVELDAASSRLLAPWGGAGRIEKEYDLEVCKRGRCAAAVDDCG